MKTRLTPLDQLGARELSGWRELADRALDPNPFFDPDFVLPAARGLGATGAVALLTVEDADGWRACLPLRRHRRWQRLPLPCVAAWVHEYCLLGSPLVAPDEPATALGAALATMRRQRGSAFAALPWTAADGPLAAALAAAGDTAIPYDGWERAAFRHPGEVGPAERVKGKHRREFRRLARGLEEEMDAPLELVDRSGEAAALESFLRLESAGWKGRAGTAIASVPAHAGFVRDLAARFAARGALRLLLLEAEGRPAAGRLSLRAGGTDFCFKVAYDERLGRFSPGRELELRLLDRIDAAAEPVGLDSCTDPANVLYNRLWPDRRRIATLAYRSSEPLGAVARPALGAMVALREERRRRHRRTDRG